ncbi:glutathione peroxidase [Luteimonas sp. S4-F44]|uniref:glutathione peroxidase n=1 Tax=Luteimonas sp. S4-F44 TaxID=2925842 RepID=UPI001F53208D|nr:glutathione peroxidase [Luteimonas sp. S4-F44]UNK41139.1 glutathione peroxidase [Luteimonas sp. S4-F44]
MTTVHDFTARTLDGADQPLSDFADRVLLIVNVASRCGFTPQYAGLQGLWQDYRDRGLVVLGFPCDQFGHQEPGDADAIRNFCALNYAVDFPMFAKVEVNGPNAHPLWAWLRGQKRGLLGTRRIKWNFTKFLVGRDGCVRARYAPSTAPDALRGRIETILDEDASPARR